MSIYFFLIHKEIESSKLDGQNTYLKSRKDGNVSVILRFSFSNTT